jgi:HK97 gp10 family phage protein
VRLSNFNINRYDGEFAEASMERLRKAAEVIADKARALCPVKTGALQKSIRVVEKTDQEGKPLAAGRNIRVYAGSHEVPYANIVEYRHRGKGRPYMRPALSRSKAKIRDILKNG